jgi:hypothetical protein
LVQFPHPEAKGIWQRVLEHAKPGAQLEVNSHKLKMTKSDIAKDELVVVQRVAGLTHLLLRQSNTSVVDASDRCKGVSAGLN